MLPVLLKILQLLTANSRAFSQYKRDIEVVVNMPDPIKKDRKVQSIWILSTLVFLLFVLIGLQTFQTAQLKSKASERKGNERAIQIALEGYATDTGGVYPTHFRDSLPFFPGGSNRLGGQPGMLPVKDIEGIIDIGPMQPGQFDKWLRSHLHDTFKAKQIIYCGLESGKGYAVALSDQKGKLVCGTEGSPTILSNP